MIIKPYTRIFILVFVLSLTHLLSFSQHKNFKIDRSLPSWIVPVNSTGVKIKDKDVIDGYYASLVENQHHVELKENFTHAFREIISEAGVQNGSQLSITFDPSFQQLTVHKVTLWRDNKSHDKLAVSKFHVLQNETDLSKFIYSGSFNAYIIIDDVRKGDRLEFAFTLKGTNPIWGNKYSDEIYFEGPYVTGQTYDNVIVSKNRKLQFKSFNSSSKPKVTNKGSLLLYEWENRNTHTYPNESYSTSWYNPFKRTQISEFQNWEEIVEWGLKVNEYPNLKTPALDKLSADLKEKANNDPLKYIELATRFAQDQIRYMGIEIGKYSHRPNSPEKVLKQRYGDCKDKSLLLIYLLKKANISAYMAYVATHKGQKLNDFLPSPFLFNHVVVYLDDQNKKMWIDPTISYQRGPISKNFFPDYGYALILKAGNKKLERVNSLATGKVISNSIFTVQDTSNKGKTTLTINNTYSDNYADNIRSSLANQGMDAVEKSYLDYVKNYYPESEKNTDIIVNDDQINNTIALTESYTIHNIWQHEDAKNKNTFINFYGDLVTANLMTINPKGRTGPIGIGHPINIEQHVSLKLPFQPGFSYESHTVENPFFHFEYDTAIHGSTITLNYYYNTNQNHVPVENIQEFIKDSKEVTDLLYYTISHHSTAEPHINYYLLVLALFTIVSAAYIFTRIYCQRKEFDIDKINDAIPIGGWLVLLGLNLCFSVISLPLQLYQSAIMHYSSWEALVPPGTVLSYFIRSIYILELIFGCIQISWLCLLVTLYFKRRDIFPNQIIKYLIFTTSFLIFDEIAVGMINGSLNKPLIDAGSFLKVLLRIIISILWVVYLKNSFRVAQTFVFTYPELSWKDAMKKQPQQIEQKD